MPHLSREHRAGVWHPGSSYLSVKRYVDGPAPFWEGGYDPIEGLRKVPCSRTWDEIRGRNRKVVVEARDRLPSEEVRQH